MSRKTKKGRTRFLPLIGISVWAAVLTGCAASSDSSDYDEHSPREIMTEAPREGMTDTSHEFMTDTSREFMADASREEAVRHADTATRSETEPAAEALFPEETAAGRTLKTSERRTEEISEGGTEDTTAQTDMRPVTSPDASSSAGDSQSLLTLLREQAERQERKARQRRLLRLCRHAFGRDFTFARIIPQDPLEVWNDTLSQRRAAAADGHYRDLLAFCRIEDLRFPQADPGIELLERRLFNMISGYEGIWSVYTKNLMNGEELVIHDISMRSASVMKLFVMAAVYQAIEDGSLERTSEVTARLSAMISASSNEDANYLLALLGENDFGRGIDRVNQYLHDHGYSRRTHEYNGFQSEAAILDRLHSNRVTARDCAKLLESIYHRQFGSYAVCSEVEKFMLAQQTRYKIPAGIARAADGILIGNKTGEMDDVENDVAIVYSPACDYVVCIFSDGWTVKDTAQKQIQDLSEEIYRYYNDSTWLEKAVNVPAALMDDGSCLI